MEFTRTHSELPNQPIVHWFIPPSVYFHPHILSAPFYLFHSVSVIMSVLSFYSVGSTRTLLFRQSRARVVGAPLSSRLLLSHRTPEPHFKGLLGLAVYPERLIWHGWHLAGLRRIPLQPAFALKYSHGSCISFILFIWGLKRTHSWINIFGSLWSMYKNQCGRLDYQNEIYLHVFVSHNLVWPSHWWMSQRHTWRPGRVPQSILTGNGRKIPIFCPISFLLSTGLLYW